MNESKAFALALWGCLAGAVIMLAGLGIDAALHTEDPHLVERESLWSLGNPGHLLLAVGIALVVVGITSATVMHSRGRATAGRTPLAMPDQTLAAAGE